MVAKLEYREVLVRFKPLNANDITQNELGDWESINPPVKIVVDLAISEHSSHALSFWSLALSFGRRLKAALIFNISVNFHRIYAHTCGFQYEIFSSFFLLECYQGQSKTTKAQLWKQTFIYNKEASDIKPKSLGNLKGTSCLVNTYSGELCVAFSETNA
ncbi:Uncharacterized protein Fot_15398 [Forsythia ovata]|uniref:Uncharacterized protein n=1 Tax=Forsythia ovata TaxID=205694 RepID=A0ABD1W912_9LAMI